MDQLVDRQQVKMWERNMFLALQGDNVNTISTIQKLINGNNNGFDLNSEMGPFPKRERGPKFHTALTWSSFQGNLNLVKFIISEGAAPEKFTSQGLTAIHCASMKDNSGNLAVVKYLLEHPRFKTDINFCNKHDGVTPLMYACSCGCYNIAEYLLQQNAEVNKQDKKGRSALFYAVRGGHLNLIKLLVVHDACVCLRDNNNATVLHHLMTVGSKVPVTLFWNVLTYLVDEKGLSVQTPACNGSTVLHEACRNGLTEVVGYLIRKGGNPESKINGWETPLWSLVMGKYPHPEMIGLLLEKGANFEARHCLGMTLIQYAKQVSKNTRVIEALENAQRVLRANRMKTLLAKRRAILSFFAEPTTGVADCVVARDTPVKRALIHTAVSNDDDRKLKKICDSNSGDKNDDVCSSISSGSFEDEDDASSDCNNCSSSSDTEEMIQGEELTDDDDDASNDDDINALTTTSSTSSTAATMQITLPFSSDDVEQEEKTHDDSIVPLPSNKRNNFDADECFERLLRKKRLLEQQLFEEEQEEKAVPQVPVSAVPVVPQKNHVCTKK